MAKALDWAWNLPQGQRISARYEPSTRTESVWLEKRLVSRSTPQGKKDAHIIPLGAGVGGGAYRGAAEARLVFEIPATGTPLCKLTIDGQLLAPASMPPMAKAAAAGGVGLLLFAIFRFAVVLAFPRHRYTKPEVPHSFHVGFIDLPGAGSTVITQIQPVIDRCYRSGISGRVVVEVHLEPDGLVASSAVAQHGRLPSAVEDCIAHAAAMARYEDAPSSTLQFPVDYVP